ncbi:hypothetical protein CRG98_021239 [Punica granatum]|uniref:Uncharacterized protein n=1 Tax=Punica granatum TaxID=22663 RepID=A0A2I0JPZ2_PUNGR|nr:hypothetical protein CRG98_021239 [Punica granatum]
MAWSATMIGALLGLGTQMYSNALRKLPYMRHPWEHVIGMGLGAVFVNQLVKWDAQLKEDLDKMLEKAKAANERRYFVLRTEALNTLGVVKILKDSCIFLFVVVKSPAIWYYTPVCIAHGPNILFMYLCLV